MTRDEVLNARKERRKIRHVPTDGVYCLGHVCKSRVAFGEWVDAILYVRREEACDGPFYIRPLDQFHNFVEVEE